MIKIGDRVRYVNEQTPEVTGTVTATYGGFVTISLDEPVFDQTTLLLDGADCVVIGEAAEAVDLNYFGSGRND